MVYSVNGLVCCLLQVTFHSLTIEPRGTNHLTSTFIANSYFPVVPILASDFHKSIELINLTITVYMVFQAICMSPDFLNDALKDIPPVPVLLFWGTLSDHIGRRPIYLACLLVVCLVSIGLALVPTSKYWLLLLLRCLQATGSASAIALGSLSFPE